MHHLFRNNVCVCVCVFGNNQNIHSVCVCVEGFLLIETGATEKTTNIGEIA